MKWFENISVILWLAMDISWSYDFIFLSILLGSLSAVFQAIHIEHAKNELEAIEGNASFFWILANLSWCAELHTAKSLAFMLAIFFTIAVILKNGKLKRGK